MLAACSDISVLDEALLRPGRLQHHIELELPNRTDIEDILKGRIKKLKCSDDVCVRDLGGILVEKLDFCVTGADVEHVCRRALMSRIREHIMEGSGGSSAGPKNISENVIQKVPEKVLEKVSNNVHRNLSTNDSNNIDIGSDNCSNNGDGNDDNIITDERGKRDVEESDEDISIGMRNFLQALEECFPSLSLSLGDLNSSVENAAAVDCQSVPEEPSFVWSGDFSGGVNLHQR